MKLLSVMMTPSVPSRTKAPILEISFRFGSRVTDRGVSGGRGLSRAQSPPDGLVRGSKKVGLFAVKRRPWNVIFLAGNAWVPRISKSVAKVGTTTLSGGSGSASTAVVSGIRSMVRLQRATLGGVRNQMELPGNGIKPKLIRRVKVLHITCHQRREEG